MREYKSYFRDEIEAMTSYAPGEQPKIENLIKLNTNENPYPPSPKADEVLRNFEISKLNRYPNATSDEFCLAVAKRNNITRDMVIACNGSDDLLTMVFRAFTSDKLSISCFNPTYSLYDVLAKMQNAKVNKIELIGEDFTLPNDALEQAKSSNLLIITRPNAPTGNSYELTKVEEICAKFEGIVLIDEAYADFADDNCMEFAIKYPNVIVSRTMSKSYSLAGLRFGYAVANKEIINGLCKLKDSYNVDMLAQKLALAAYEDEEYLKLTSTKIIESRNKLKKELEDLGFRVIESEGNFLFARPKNGDGEGYFKHLRDHNIIVRYFSGERTKEFARISIGTEIEMDRLVEVTRVFWG